MATFWRLMEESVIVQSLLALITTSAIVWALLAGINIPDQLYALWGIIIGWYFGAKAQNGTKIAIDTIEKYHQASNRKV